MWWRGCAWRMSWRKRQGRGREPGGRELPSREALAEIVHAVCGALFPCGWARPICAKKAKIFTLATPWTAR